MLLGSGDIIQHYPNHISFVGRPNPVLHLPHCCSLRSSKNSCDTRACSAVAWHRLRNPQDSVWGRHSRWPHMKAPTVLLIEILASVERVFARLHLDFVVLQGRRLREAVPQRDAALPRRGGILPFLGVGRLGCVFASVAAAVGGAERAAYDGVAEVAAHEGSERWRAGEDDGEVAFEEGPDEELEACP